MKRTLALLLIAAVLITAGCGSSTKAPASSAAPAAPAASKEQKVDADYIFATGGTGGTYYPYGGNIAALINKYTGSNITVNSTGASVENCRLIASGDADMGFVQSDVTFYALEGSNAFQDTGPVKGLKVMASVYPEDVHIATTNPSIKTFYDLKGKRFSVGAAGSGNEVVAKLLLKEHGMSYDDIDERHLVDAEGKDGVQDGTLDAYLTCTAQPSPSVTELSIVKNVHLISIDKEIRDKIISENRFFSEAVFKKEVYKTEEDVHTLAVSALILVSESLPEEHVYLMTKALFDNQPELAAVHAKGKNLSLEAALDGVIPGTLHPGAERYFKEKGLKVD